MHRLAGLLLPKPRRRLRWVIGLLVLLGVLLVVGGHLRARHEFSAARTALDEDRFDDARRHLAWCLRCWPWDVEVRLFAARMERTANNFASAAAFLNECEKLQGASNATQLEWIFLRAETGETAEAEESLRNAIASESPETNLILEVLARLAMRERRLAKARDALQQWLGHDPDSARAWYWLGWVLQQLGSRVEAIEAYRHALALQPNRWRAALSLANLFLERKQSGAASPYLEQLRQLRPDQPEVIIADARYHALRNEEEEVRRALDRLLEAHPDNVDGLILRGKLECESGRPDVGETYVRRALERRPKEIEALYQYYRCLQLQPGRRKEAAAVLAEHESLRRDRDRLDQLLRAEVEKNPDDPDLCAEIGRLLQRLGKDTAAVEWYYRALRRNPDMERVHEALKAHFEKIGDRERAAQHRDELARLRGKVPGP
jgi:tetratricopeptide (TPR) repeat protein